MAFTQLLAALPHTIGFALPPLTLWAAEAGGVWMWLPVAAMYAGVPVADAVVGLNPRTPTAGEVVALERNIWFRMVTGLWVPMHAALVVWALWFADTHTLSGWEWAGLVVSVGSIGGAIGITFAHELIHRSGRFERILGDVVLALVTYPHFAVEHVHGHHRHVATPADPATAKLGEGFYHFLPRTLAGSLRHAWHLKPRIVARHAATMAALYGAIWWLWHRWGVAFFALQSVVAFTLLESINYVEHYGLVRREIAPGRYERVGPRHSWDSSHRVSNWVLINLARHADHHLIASRRYQALASQAAAPQLPAGYGTMLLLAFVPPLWRKVMDGEAARWRDGTAE
jgi:alkane 1-monooxygenase